MDKLGIQPSLLLTQIVNFTILLLVLTKFLYKPILKGLEERRKKIEAGLAFSEKAKTEEEKLVQRRQEMIKEAREESKIILDNVRKESKQVKEEYVLQGKKEVEELKQKLEAEFHVREEALQAQMTKQTVDIAAEMMKRLLPELLTDEAQHKLIRKQLEKMEKVHGK